MFKWLANLVKEDPQEVYNRGYQYVVSEWNKDPSLETARKLRIEQDNSFDSNQFERGMLEAFHDLKVPDPFDPLY